MEKINIAELLRNCPSGMELDCTMYDNAYFERVEENVAYPIRVKIGKTDVINLTKEGCWNRFSNAKCVIFPKGKTTWEGFQRPFKDGDIIYNRLQNRVCICYIPDDGVLRIRYVRYNEYDKQFEILDFPIPISIQDYRLATEEEKQKLFDAIKKNGYKWNPETKILEKSIKPKFKVGNRIRNVQVDLGNIYTIIEVGESSYVVNKNNENNNYDIDFVLQDDWELAPNKFDITTLKPFESKVLVRHTETSIWMPAIFGGYDITNLAYYVVGGTWWKYCIPYKGNEYLRGSTDDCNDFYKTWKK